MLGEVDKQIAEQHRYRRACVLLHCVREHGEQGDGEHEPGAEGDQQPLSGPSTGIRSGDYQPASQVGPGCDQRVKQCGVHVPVSGIIGGKIY